MKTFVLCRHAKSDWPAGVADDQRPLKKRGITDAHDIGELLQKNDFYPDIILSSHAKRAHTTAQIIAKQLDWEQEIQIVEDIYHEGAGKLIEVIQNVPSSADTIMIFGHNPTMEQAVQFFLQSSRPTQMPTCAMACFEHHNPQWESLSPNTVYLRWLLIPRLKRKDS